MRKAVPYLLFLTFVSFFVDAHAQKITGKISGTVFSDSLKQPLANASISLIDVKDSTVEKMTISDTRGSFKFNDLRLTDYRVLVTVINHLPLSTRVTLSRQKKEVILDSLIMKFTADSLMAVTVKSYVPPVVIKTDTTEFNAGSFKVKENGMVEDLLKKLPGIEMQKDGSVQAQGQKVTQIFVDGKPFFGDDPKMVTQNLPANIIDKVQIIDKKSEQAQVTKVEDGEREKVINITIKKNKKKGVFGMAYAGYGTSDRYEDKVAANYFNNERRISIVAGSNNTGRNDYNSGNDESASYNNSNGVTKTRQVKAAFTDKWGKKFDVNANVGYGDNTNTTEQIRNRQNIFGDSTNYYFDKSVSTRTNSGINSGVGFEYKPDTLTTIRLNEYANFGKSSYSTSSIFNSSLINSKKINDGDRLNTGATTSPSIAGNLTLTRRFKKERRAAFFNFNNNINSSITDGFNISNNFFYPVNSIEYQLLLNQLLNNDNRATSINSSISYSEPIGKKSAINLSTNYGFNNNNAIRETFDFNNASGNYDILNDTLSSNFKNANYNTSVGVNYNYSLKKGNISVGTTWQDSKTKSRSLTKDSLYLQHFSGFVPYLNIHLNNKGKQLALNYNFSNRAPQAFQLQPIIDNSNPLYIRYGNPNLKYSTNHRINVNFNSYNAKKETSFYTNVSLSLTHNNISNSTSYDQATGSQTSRPINVNGVYNINGNLNYSKPIKIWSAKLTWSNNASFSLARNLSLLNNERNINKTASGRWSTGINCEIGENVEIDIRSDATIQNTGFSQKSELNTTYYTYGGEYSLEADIGKLMEVKVSGDLTRNTGRAAGFNRNIHIVNADVTQYMNSRKTWWVRVKVYDLLKQNLSVYRYSGENFIEDTQTKVLSRFFLLSLNYKLSKFGGGR